MTFDLFKDSLTSSLDDMEAGPASRRSNNNKGGASRRRGEKMVNIGEADEMVRDIFPILTNR